MGNVESGNFVYQENRAKTLTRSLSGFKDTHECFIIQKRPPIVEWKTPQGEDMEVTVTRKFMTGWYDVCRSLYQDLEVSGAKDVADLIWNNVLYSIPSAKSKDNGSNDG